MWQLLGVAVVAYFLRGRIASKLSFLQADPQRTNFMGHLVILCSAIAYLLPLDLLGLDIVKRLSFMLALWTTVFNSMMTIVANYGLPPVPQTGGLNMAAMKASFAQAQPWLQNALMGVEFSFLFLALIFLVANPTVFVLAILGRRSLWSVSTYCSKNSPENRLWRQFAPTWAKLQANEPKILFTSTLGEIALGFWLTIQLVMPTRQILTCFLYWNYLRTRYQVPRSRKTHGEAWSFLQTKVQPLLKALPFLNMPINYAKNWFQPQYATRQG